MNKFAITVDGNTVPEMVRTDRHRVALCHGAIQLAFRQGIFSMFRTAPVLDVGCGNPYEYLYRTLRRYAWDGAYVGIDRSLPDLSGQYADDIYVYGGNVSEILGQMPPNDGHPLKEYGTGFIINPPQNGLELESIICEMKRICVQVVAIGAPVGLLRLLDFQRWGNLGDTINPWAIWFNEWGEKRRAHQDLLPESGLAWFMPKGGKATQKRVWACEKCGQLNHTGAEKFKCLNQKCGHENRNERKRYGHYRTDDNR